MLVSWARLSLVCSNVFHEVCTCHAMFCEFDDTLWNAVNVANNFYRSSMGVLVKVKLVETEWLALFVYS